MPRSTASSWSAAILIAGSYERCHGLWSFYVRRVFRLYPMYALRRGAPGGDHARAAAWRTVQRTDCSTLRYSRANMLLANFLQYDIGGVLAGLHNPGINPSLWTLKIEIGFYLIVPLIYMA